MLSRLRISLSALLVLIASLPVMAQNKQDDKVKDAIKNGMKYLREIEKGKGNFEHTTRISAVRPGGVTALATVALLKNGVPAKDPLIQRCLKYLRTLEPLDTYTVGLQTMAFALAGEKEDRNLIERNLEWLGRTVRDGGWGYNEQICSPDHSITHYALLGIREAHRTGIKINKDVLKALREHYSGNAKGEWAYRTGAVSSTMTSAGLFNLLVTVEMLGDKSTRQEQQITQKALRWLGDDFPADIAKADDFKQPFYCLYCIRSAGEKAEQRELGRKDWRKVGSTFLLNKQNKDGSWEGNGPSLDHWPPVATSLALLFLAPK